MKLAGYLIGTVVFAIPTLVIVGYGLYATTGIAAFCVSLVMLAATAALIVADW
jgi:hypothetical protein